METADPKKYDNKTLVDGLKGLVGEERMILGQVLKCLREVDLRRLFLKMGYPNLFEFCVKELGYSEASAYRRISAMRLMNEVPQVKQKLEDGALSLTAAAQAQNYFKKKEKSLEPVSRAQKEKILARFENLSSRECEKELIRLDPEVMKRDKIRLVTDELTEIRITVTKDFIQKLDRLREIHSHSLAEGSTVQLLEYVMDEHLKRQDPLSKKSRGEKIEKTAEAAEAEGSVVTTETKSESASAPKSKSKSEKDVNFLFRSATSAPKWNAETDLGLGKASRNVPAQVRLEVMKKYKGECCYIDQASGRRCGSRRYVQIDHIVPFSKGGQHVVENLQLLCANHNRWKGARLN